MASRQVRAKHVEVITEKTIAPDMGFRCDLSLSGGIVHQIEPLFDALKAGLYGGDLPAMQVLALDQTSGQ